MKLAITWYAFGGGPWYIYEDGELWVGEPEEPDRRRWEELRQLKARGEDTILRVKLTGGERERLEKTLAAVDPERLAESYDGKPMWVDTQRVVFVFPMEGGGVREVTYTRSDSVIVPELDRLVEAVDELVPRRYQIHPRPRCRSVGAGGGGRESGD